MMKIIRRSLDHSVAPNGGMTSLKFVCGCRDKRVVYRCCGEGVCDVKVC